MADKMIKVTQIKSHHGRIENQKANLIGLGLGRRIGCEKILKDTPEVRGMIRKVNHLIKVEEVK